MPPPPPPIYCPKEGQTKGKKNYLKTFEFRLNHPPFWIMSKKRGFFMACLSNFKNYPKKFKKIPKKNLTSFLKKSKVLNKKKISKHKKNEKKI